MTGLITTVIMILCVVGIVLTTSGLLHLRNSEDEAGLTIDKNKRNE